MTDISARWKSFKEKRRKKKNKPYRIFKGIPYYTRKKYERAISDVIKDELRLIERIDRSLIERP